MTHRRLRSLGQRFSVAALALIALSTYAADPTERVVRVGFVHPQSPSTAVRGVGALWERLRELGYIEGRNLIIETRWAEGRDERLPALVAEVLGRKLDVLVTYGTPSAVAAKNATGTVPIVAMSMGEPLRTGLVTSLARPGGNLSRSFKLRGPKGSGANGWSCCRRPFRGYPPSR